VGINTDKIITGINFLAISDTPGFGQKAAEPAFYEQFAGKDAAGSFVPGTDFDGISGATITTNGVANILSEAAKIGVEYLDAI
jgi:electron transport complex protein RnfG